MSTVLPDFKDREGKWVISFWDNSKKQSYCSRIGNLYCSLKQRCKAGGSMHRKHPSYRNCTLSDLFKDPQTFGDWYTSQIGYEEQGWHLDKDLLLKGNKHYSEDTCVILPQQINAFLVKCGARRGEHPIGVSLRKRNGKFLASLSTDGFPRQLGSFDTAIEAFMCHKAAKEAHARVLAERWYGKIDIRAYNALMSYTVEITD